MQHLEKRECILDAMQDLMNQNLAETISVSDIAKKAGIGKGSIYYYFQSKNDIIEAVIERSYSNAIEESKRLVSSRDIDAFTKMEIIFRTCLESSSELKRQEQSSTFIGIQQSALIHQQFVSIITRNLKPILADIIRQGIREGSIRCELPDEIAEIVLLILTVKFDNYLLPSSPEEIQRTMEAFSVMLEKSTEVSRDRLQFLKYPGQSGD